MAEDQYFNHYGLEKNPFSEVKDEKEFFETPEIEHRIELIKHLIEFSDRIIVVTGEEGSGKTTLLYNLVTTRDEKWHLCRLSFNDINTVGDFFKQIFSDQKLQYREMESYASKVSVLHDVFEEMQIKGYIPVLFIDDAHYLSIEILKLLFELAITKNNKPALHVVLFSETNIAELINHRNLGFIHTLEMPLYNEEQVSMYIAHRLMSTGYQGEEVISQKQIKGIHRTSNGLPGLINELALKALQDPALKTESTNWIDTLYKYALNPKITMPLALILVAIFVVYTLQIEVDEEEIKHQTKEISLPTQQEPTQSQEAVEANKVAKFNDTEPESIIEEPDIVFLNQNGEIIAETEEVETQLTNQVQETKLEEASKVIDEETINSPIDSLDNKKNLIQEIIPKELEQLTKPSEEEIVTATPFATEKATETKAETLQDKIEKTEVPQTTKTQTKNTNNQTVRDSDWLKQQSPNHYVLQLMGAYDDVAMNKFIAKNIRNKSELAKFTTVNQNKTWYVLVYGKYANRDQAVAAIPSLPSVLRELKPWPRKIETIQRDLR